MQIHKLRLCNYTVFLMDDGGVHEDWTFIFDNIDEIYISTSIFNIHNIGRVIASAFGPNNQLDRIISILTDDEFDQILSNPLHEIIFTDDEEKKESYKKHWEFL